MTAYTTTNGLDSLADLIEKMDAASRSMEAIIIPETPAMTPQLWSPLEIEIILFHYYTAPGIKHRLDGETIYARAVTRFVEEDLLSWHGVRAEDPVITDKGRAFINMLLNTPLPVLQIVDPRTGEVVA